MNRMWMHLALLAPALFAPAAHASPVPTPMDGYLSYSGTATARHSGKFLYGERHVLLYRGGRIAERTVLYTCGGGSPFARKAVTYVDPIAPDFRLEDVSGGMLEGIRTDGAARTVFFRARRGDADKAGPLPGTAGLVADAGFDEFVHMHWDRLMSGKALSMRFLVPSRLDDFGFQVQHLRSDAFDGVPTEVFRLKLSGIWGWFLPGIDVAYSAADRVLVRYDGLSDLRDAAGDNFQTEITFRHADRQPSDDRAMRAARETPLAPCR